MSYRLEFLPEVEQDVKQAYDWYELQRLGLGEDFLLSADAAIESIQRSPFHFQQVHKAVRKVKTKRFPYGVFFLVESEIITVIAVLHLARHPKKWKQRAAKKK